jgi:hypothetical protein
VEPLERPRSCSVVVWGKHWKCSFERGAVVSLQVVINLQFPSVATLEIASVVFAASVSQDYRCGSVFWN